jgi:hypothetical protein
MPETNQRQKFEITNEQSTILEIMIEPYPDRYILRPGDKMVFEADLGGAPLTINTFDGGMQIYAGWESEFRVTINDVAVEPDWTTIIQR